MNESIVSEPIVPHFLVFLTLLVGQVVPAIPEIEQYNHRTNTIVYV